MGFPTCRSVVFPSACTIVVVAMAWICFGLCNPLLHPLGFQPNPTWIGMYESGYSPGCEEVINCSVVGVNFFPLQMRFSTFVFVLGVQSCLHRCMSTSFCSVSFWQFSVVCFAACCPRIGMPCSAAVLTLCSCIGSATLPCSICTSTGTSPCPLLALLSLQFCAFLPHVAHPGWFRCFVQISMLVDTYVRLNVTVFSIMLCLYVPELLQIPGWSVPLLLELRFVFEQWMKPCT